jgi:hypothetical protein
MPIIGGLIKSLAMDIGISAGSKRLLQGMSSALENNIIPLQGLLNLKPGQTE